MTVIEAELKKIYFLAEDLVGETAFEVSTLPALVAPVGVTPTDVVLKSTSRVGTRRRQSERRVSATLDASQLPDNAAKLLRYLETVLNMDEFRLIKQTTSARTVGMPLGSVSAAIKKLLASGHLVAGSAGGLKLNRFDTAEDLV